MDVVVLDNGLGPWQTVSIAEEKTLTKQKLKTYMGRVTHLSSETGEGKIRVFFRVPWKGHVEKIGVKKFNTLHVRGLPTGVGDVVQVKALKNDRVACVRVVCKKKAEGKNNV